MKEEDKKRFLNDFRKADVPKKLDMWYHALEQEGLWEEILAEMSEIAQSQSTKQSTSVEE
jgi:primosomal protein N''